MRGNEASTLPIHLLSYAIEHPQPAFCSFTVIVPASIVDLLYHHAMHAHQAHVQAYGFAKGTVPVAYIANTYQTSLQEHIKEFLFKYFVLSYLLYEIMRQKQLVVGDPRLSTIECEPGKDAQFKFELSLFESLPLSEWKYFPFKAPKRKNYKDLDRQVEGFLAQEKSQYDAEQRHDQIAVGDWVYFSVGLVDRNEQPIFEEPSNFWLKIGDEEADKLFHEVFLQKKIGQRIISTNKSLQDSLSGQLDLNYRFLVEIKDILKNSYFCLELFKNYFKLKTNKEINQKLIEVFSYRNDISQRRATVEEALALLFSKHRFEVPHYLALRQQKAVLDAIVTNPDYHVYRMQKDFKERVKELAEKQIREQILVDHITYDQGLTVAHADIKAYLNMYKRARMKEFIYFDPPTSKQRGQEVPVNTAEMARACLREKAINHVIYHLTKK